MQRNAFRDAITDEIYEHLVFDGLTDAFRKVHDFTKLK
jgi:aspartate/methionine/tyrosine aminotransferase